MAHAMRWNVRVPPKQSRWAPGLATLSASSNMGVMASWNVMPLWDDLPDSALPNVSHFDDMKLRL